MNRNEEESRKRSHQRMESPAISPSPPSSSSMWEEEIFATQQPGVFLVCRRLRLDLDPEVRSQIIGNIQPEDDDQ